MAACRDSFRLLGPHKCVFPRNPIKISLQISLHFFMCCFILEVKISCNVKIFQEPGSRVPYFFQVWQQRNNKREQPCDLKGCGMGPCLVLVSPCFRENVVVTCKIGSFLCSLDTLLQKNVNCFLFWKSYFKMALIWKRAILTHFSHSLVTRESYKNSFSTYITHIHTCILLTSLTFLPYQFWKKYEFIRYGFSLVVLVLTLIRAILEQSINN